MNTNKNGVSQSDAVRDAYTRGYRVTDLGELRRGEAILNPRPNSGGYKRFSIKILGTRKTVQVPVHRLAAYQVFGESMFEDGICVRHLDGDPSNNALANIAIGTQSQNMMDRRPSDRLAHAKNASSHITVYSHDDVLMDYRTIGWRATLEKHGMSKGNLSYIINKI